MKTVLEGMLQAFAVVVFFLASMTCFFSAFSEHPTPWWWRLLFIGGYVATGLATAAFAWQAGLGVEVDRAKYKADIAAGKYR